MSDVTAANKPTWKFRWAEGFLSYRPSSGIMPPTAVTDEVRKTLTKRYGTKTVAGTFDADGKIVVGRP